MHRHLVVSGRSFLGDTHVESLSSWSVACTSCARLGKLDELASADRIDSPYSLASARLGVFPRHRLSVRGCIQMVSENLCPLLKVESCGHWFQSPCRCRLKSKPRTRAPRWFLIWYFVMWLPKRTSMTSPSTTVSSSSSESPSSVMSSKCRVRPSRTDLLSPGNSDATASIPSASSLVAGPTCVRLHLCKQLRMCTDTVSFRPGFGWFFTQDAHSRSTPSLSSILSSVYENGFSSSQCPLWFPSSTVSCCRHRSAVGGD